MSLRDQLLKAGLVSKKKLKTFEASSKKQNYSAKHSKKLAQELEQKKEQELEDAFLDKHNQQLKDKELNKKIYTELLQRENINRAKMLIRSHNLLSTRAPIAYYFKNHDRVERLLVTFWQKELLSKGELAIVSSIARDRKEDDFALVSLNTAKTLKELYPSSIIVLHDKISSQELEKFYDL